MDSRDDVDAEIAPARRPTQLVFAMQMLLVLPIMLLLSLGMFAFVGSVLAGPDATIVPPIAAALVVLILCLFLRSDLKNGSDRARWVAITAFAIAGGLGPVGFLDPLARVLAVMAAPCLVAMVLLLHRNSVEYCGGSANPPHDVVASVGRALGLLLLVAAVVGYAVARDDESLLYALIGYAAAATILIALAPALRAGEPMAKVGYVLCGIVLAASAIVLGVVSPSLLMKLVAAVGFACGLLVAAGALSARD